MEAPVFRRFSEAARSAPRKASAVRESEGGVRTWPRPRIGHLKHHEPRPLKVPAKYLRKVGPHPAPTISVVTPSFQQGRFLERTLISVLGQEYPALEYIVQDGGSSDGSVEVLRRFEPFLTSWRSESDAGQADALNRAFARSSGEIMAWLNSDDLMLPGSLAYVARYFTKHPEVDVVYGHRVMIDENDGKIGSWILPSHDGVALTLADFVPQETLYWRRRIWEATGATLDSSFGNALDWELLLRFQEVGARMVRVPRYLGAFRVHPGQKSSAEKAVGLQECGLLHERVHGRRIPSDEVLRRLTPYFVRHIVEHTLHSLANLLPLRRVCVETARELSDPLAR